MNIWDTLAKKHGTKTPELERKLYNKERDYHELQNDYMYLKMKLDEYVGLFENTPTGCKVGPWCKACEFGKHFVFYNSFCQEDELYYCGKAEACKNFVQKGD